MDNKQQDQTAQKTVKPKPKAPAVPEQSQMGMFDEFAIPQPVLNAGSIDGQADALQRMGLTQQQKTVANLGKVHGNNYVQRLVGTIHHKQNHSQQAPTVQAKAPSPSLTIQPKLTVNEPDDQFEVEADRVADQVMKMPAPATPPPPPNETGNNGNNNEGNGNTNGIASVQKSSQPTSLAPTTAPAIPQPPRVYLQTKLTVNEPNDQFEVEADRVADQVMKMPAPATPPPVDNNDENNEQTAVTPINISRVQASGDVSGGEVTPDVENRINRMQGGGSPLPDDTRTFFEDRMGADFSNVRIHTDGNAVQTSRDIQARAFTVGNNIAFNSGEYNPNTDSGKHLLAHELTHTLQQGGAVQAQRKPASDEGVCPVCGKMGKTGSTCSGCGQKFAPIQRKPIQQSQPTAIQRSLSEDEGVCPTCGKTGKLGTSCSGCGKTFVPIQRMPINPNERFQQTLESIQGNLPPQLQEGLDLGQDSAPDAFMGEEMSQLLPDQAGLGMTQDDGTGNPLDQGMGALGELIPDEAMMGLGVVETAISNPEELPGIGLELASEHLPEEAQAGLEMVQDGISNPEGLLDQGMDALGGLIPDEAMMGLGVVETAISNPEELPGIGLELASEHLPEEAQTAVDLAQTAINNPEELLNQGISALGGLFGGKQTPEEQKQTAQEAQQAQTDRANQQLEETKGAAQDRLNGTQERPENGQQATEPQSATGEQATNQAGTELPTPPAAPDLAGTDSLISGESGGMSMPDLLNGENPFPASPQEMISSLLTDTIASTLDSIAEAIDLQNLPPAVTDMPSFEGFSISEAFETFKDSVTNIEFPIADKQQTATESPQAETTTPTTAEPPTAGESLDVSSLTDASALAETATSFLTDRGQAPDQSATERAETTQPATDSKQTEPATERTATPTTEQTAPEKPSDLIDTKARETEQTAVTQPPQQTAQPPSPSQPTKPPQPETPSLQTPALPNAPEAEIAPSKADDSEIDTAIEEIKAGAQSPATTPQMPTVQAKHTPNIQRFSLIPGWVDDALDALRGKAGSKEGEVRGEGSTSDSQIRSDAESKGSEIQGDGQSRGSELQSDGQTRSSEVQTDGQTRGAEVDTDGQTRGAEVDTDGQTRGSEVQTDGQTRGAELEADGQTRGQQLETEGETKATELEADQTAKGEELTSEAQAKEAEVTAEAEAKEQEISTEADTKATELEADAALKAAEMGTNVAQAEGEAQAKEQELAQEVEAGEAELTTEAEQTVTTVETDWVALEAEADTLMGSLDAQAGALCSEQQANAQAFLDGLDPFIEDAQEGWKQIQEQAKEAWTAFLDFAQPALDALGEKWNQFSQWVATEVWPVLQEKVTAFAQRVGEMARGVYDWVSEKWQWLQEAWANAQEWLSTRADAAREWITEKAEAARQWVMQKADAAREWIAGKAEAASQWIANKAEAARAWIGEKADAAREWISGKADAARQWITGKADAAREWITGKADTVNQWISVKAETANQWITGKADTANQWISGQADAARSWISGKADSISGAFQSMGQSAVSGLSSRAQAAVSSVTSEGGPIMRFFGGIVNGLISGVEGVASSAVNVATSALSWGLSRVESLAQSAVTFVESAGTGAVSFVSNAATSAVSFVADKASGAVSFVADKAVGAVNFVENTANSAVTFVETSATGAVTFVEQKATSVVTSVETAATGAVTWVADKATGAVNTVETMATGAVNKLETAGMGAVDKVESMAQTAVEWAQQAWEGLKAGWDVVKSAIGSSLSWLGQKAVQLGGWVKDNVIAPASQWVRDRVQDAKNYIQENFPGLVACWELFQSFASGIQEKIHQLPLIGDVIYVIEEITEGALMGDFLEDPNGWNILGQVLIGFVPYAGQVADVRDLFAVLDKIARGEAGYGDLALNLIAFIPGIGDAFKAGKHLDQADEVIDVLTTLGRQVDEIPPALMDTLSNSSGLRNLFTENPALLESVLSHGDEGVELITRYGDDAAEIIAEYGDEGIEALLEHGDEAGDFLRRADNVGDEVADQLDDVADEFDEVADEFDEVTDQVDEVTDQVDEVTDQVDEVTDQVDEVTDQVDEAANYSDEVQAVVNRYGDEGLAIVNRYGDEGLAVINRYGDEGVDILNRYGDDGLAAINRYGDDAIETYAQYGDEATEMLREGFIAKFPLEDGHQLKIRHDGRVVRCSSCELVATQYKDLLDMDEYAHLRTRLTEIENSGKSATSIANQTQDLQRQLEAIRLVRANDSSALDSYLQAIDNAGTPLTAAQRAELGTLIRNVEAGVASGGISDALKADIQKYLEDLAPARISENPVLESIWNLSIGRSLSRKQGKKYLDELGQVRPEYLNDPEAMAEIYTAVRATMSKETEKFIETLRSTESGLNNALSSLPDNIEVHHLLYKKKVPQYAITHENLILALRGPAGVDEMHELLHRLSAGNDPDLFRVLQDDVKAVIIEVTGLTD